jgi:hypothetical protein
MMSFHKYQHANASLYFGRAISVIASSRTLFAYREPENVPIDVLRWAPHNRYGNRNGLNLESADYGSFQRLM